MTDPKSISRNREYYTDQYGNARPTTRDNAVGGSYEASVDISDEFGSDIATDPNVPDEYQEFFSDLPPESGLPNDGQLMDGVNEQVDGSIPPGAAPIQWEASQVAAEIKDLLDANKDLLKHGEAFDAFKTQFTALKNQIGDAGVDADALADQLTELKDNITGAVDELSSTNADKFDSALQTLEGLKDKVERSRLTSDQKEELTDALDDKIADFKKGKRDHEVFGENEEGLIENIQRDVNRALGEHDLKKGFENAVTRIPAKGWQWEKSVELGRRVRDAVASGEWGAVDAYLSELAPNDANNVIQQFVGSLFYGPAGKDEDKLSQLLAMIPENVRDHMATAALSNEGERLSGENVDTDAHKEEHAYYGNPTVTADRLRRNDIDDALDSLGEASASSPTTSS